MSCVSPSSLEAVGTALHGLLVGKENCAPSGSLAGEAVGPMFTTVDGGM